MSGNTLAGKISNIKLLARTLMRKPRLLPRLTNEYFRSRFLRQNRLRFMDIALDYRCNMSCTHCSAANFIQPQNTTITVEEFEKIVQDLIREGCVILHFTGGEPLLRDDLEEYIKVANPQKMIISIQSNSLLATPERLRSLRNAGADLFNISIDSGIPEENDKFRSAEGSWGIATKALDDARSVGFDVSVSTTISHESLHSEGLRKLIEWTAQKGVWCQFNLAVPVGNWHNCESFMLTQEDQNAWRSLLREYNHLRIDLNHNWHNVGCGCVKEKGYLTAYGDFMPCPFIQVGLGNVREMPISEIRKRALRIPEFASYAPCCLAAEDRNFIAKTPCYNNWQGVSPVPLASVDWMMAHINKDT